MRFEAVVKGWSAAAGDRDTPFNAWDNYRFTFYQYFRDNPKVVE
ncbi:hypothetical protein [Neobacillus vireti]